MRRKLITLQNHFSKQLIRTITTSDILKFRASRLKAPTRHKKQRSIASVNRELALLRRILNVAQLRASPVGVKGLGRNSGYAWVRERLGQQRAQQLLDRGHLVLRRWSTSISGTLNDVEPLDGVEGLGRVITLEVIGAVTVVRPVA